MHGGCQGPRTEFLFATYLNERQGHRDCDNLWDAKDTAILLYRWINYYKGSWI